MTFPMGSWKDSLTSFLILLGLGRPPLPWIIPFTSSWLTYAEGLTGP